MGEVGSGGRTVLFVSHNMNAVENLCTAVLCLESGSVKAHGGDVRGVITRHLGAASGDGSTAGVWVNSDDRLNHPVMQPLYFAVENSQGEPLTGPARNDALLCVVIRAEVRRLDPSLKAGFTLFNQDSELLLSSMTTDTARAELAAAEHRRGRTPLPASQTVPERRHLQTRVELQPAFREWIARPGRNSPTVHLTIQGGLSDSPYWLDPRPAFLLQSGNGADSVSRRARALDFRP